MRGPLRRPLIWLLAKLGPSYDIEFSGLKWRCRIDDNRTEARMLLYGLGRFKEIDRITCGLSPGDIFVDLGANSGVFSLCAARAVGSGGRVLAVEPSSIMLERLRFNVAANDFENVCIAPVAVGAQCGHAALHVVAGQRGRSSLLAVWGGNAQVKVPVEQLLPLLAAHRIERIDALKIDIEGYEDQVLVPFFAGAPRPLWPRRILLETRARSKHWQEDCVAHLLKLGYEIEWQGRKDALFVLPGQPNSAGHTLPV